MLYDTSATRIIDLLTLIPTWTRTCKAYLLAATNGELFEGSNIVDEKVHETQLVTEAHKNEVTQGMQSYAVGLLCKLLIELQLTAINKNRKTASIIVVIAIAVMVS